MLTNANPAIVILAFASLFLAGYIVLFSSKQHKKCSKISSTKGGDRE